MICISDLLSGVRAGLNVSPPVDRVQLLYAFATFNFEMDLLQLRLSYSFTVPSPPSMLFWPIAMLLYPFFPLSFPLASFPLPELFFLVFFIL